MDSEERTRDLYEQISYYQKPPLIPLPDPEDFSTLADIGLRPEGIALPVVKAALAVSGFNAFRRELPDRLEELLRRINLRGPSLFAPVIAATLALQDEPREIDSLQRAAALIWGALSLRQDVLSGKLKPDHYRGQILEMGQYPNLFGTHLIWDGKRFRIFKTRQADQISIMVDRRIYLLNLRGLDPAYALWQIKAALEEIVRHARQNRLSVHEPAPGFLTGALNPTQQKIFRRLEKEPVNRKSLALLRHSLFTVCLDVESYPESHAEAARLAHSGNYGNRWFHSSFQIVVFGNARAAIICNYTAYIDGNVMIRAGSELYHRARSWTFDQRESPDFAPLAVQGPLPWKFSSGLVRRARRDLQMVQDNQPATFELPGFGRQFFSALNLEAVPTFNVALQMVGKRLTGRMPKIRQFVAMSKYRCMDFSNVTITTPEVEELVDYLERPESRPERARELFQKAIQSQIRATRQARKNIPLPKLFSLYYFSRKKGHRAFLMLLTAATAFLLRLLGYYKPVVREVILSHPRTAPETPIIGRPGVRLPYVKYFSMHYQIMENKTVITMMPSVTWTIPNAEFMAELKECLLKIRALFTQTRLDEGQNPPGNLLKSVG